MRIARLNTLAYARLGEAPFEPFEPDGFHAAMGGE